MSESQASWDQTREYRVSWLHDDAQHMTSAASYLTVKCGCFVHKYDDDLGMTTNSFTSK